MSSCTWWDAVDVDTLSESICEEAAALLPRLALLPLVVGTELLLPFRKLRLNLDERFGFSVSSFGRWCGDVGSEGVMPLGRESARWGGEEDVIVAKEDS